VPPPERIYVNKGKRFYACFDHDAVVYTNKEPPNKDECSDAPVTLSSPRCLILGDMSYVYEYRRGDAEVYVVLQYEDAKHAWEIASKYL
jgi:hypothetical protein